MYLLLRNNIVVNILPQAPPQGWGLEDHTVVQGTADIGDVYNGSTFSKPVAPVPAELSRRQFIIGMMTEGFITETQADNLSATGVIPPPFAAVVSQLPTEMQTAAKVTIRTASVFYRNSLLIIAGLTVVGATEAQADQFFRTYSQI